MSVATYTKAGAKATTPAKLDKEVFGLEVTNHELLKQVYVAYLANGRENLAVTKTRGLVSGGGKKPWKQKGTGRARFGSSRVPIWRGGGITFGPTGLENYSQKIHTKAKRLATRQALSMAAADNKVKVIDAISLKEAKTAELSKLLTKLGVERQSLIVVANLEDKLTRASSNLSDIKIVQAKYLNVYDIVNAYNVVIEKDCLDVISDWLNPTKKEAKPVAKAAKAETK